MLNSELKNDGEEIYYHEDMFEGASKKDIQEMLNSGKGINDEKFFIKYPSWV